MHITLLAFQNWICLLKKQTQLMTMWNTNIIKTINALSSQFANYELQNVRMEMLLYSSHYQT
jgi:hypothetical protein